MVNDETGLPEHVRGDLIEKTADPGWCVA